MRFRLLVSFLVIGFCLAPVNVGFAWNRAGHMVIASLAYRELALNHPVKLKQWVKILKKHPKFVELWKPILNELAPADRNEALFLLAARWPDDAREPALKPVFHRRVWHFADHALKLNGTPASVPNGIIPSPPEPGDQDEGFHNLLEALTHNLQVIEGTEVASKKAIALCWVLHLVGDMHQPLHMTTRYSALFPQGDRGGNSSHVVVPPSHASLNYHSFWDGLILSGPKGDNLINSAPDQLADHLTEASAKAGVLAGLPAMTRANFLQLATADRNEWAKESVALSLKIAYLDGDLTGGTDAHSPFEMPNGFLTIAKDTAVHQGVLAGYRLTDLLD